MSESDHIRQHIELAIERARDGVGERIDEIDRRLRGSLDLKGKASEHAPQLLIGGAAVGFLLGFGFPRALLRIVQIVVPLAVVTKLVKARMGAESEDDEDGF